MRSFILNKLVRDKIYASMLENGQKPESHPLSRQEFMTELHKKLLEEAKEFNPNDPKAVKELADLLEVIETIAAELSIEFEDIRDEQAKRRKKAGGFNEKRYVNRLDLNDDDSWADYYAAEPDKYKEIKDAS